jgi:hypothetical protein
MRTLLLALTALAACAAPDDSSFPDHDEPSDFEEVPASDDGKADVAGIPATFDRHRVMSDELFTQSDAVDAAGLQAFFEATPYGRSWLADEVVDGRLASEVIVEVAVAHELNPVMLVARMQVEKSLVSKTVRPAQAKIDYAFGCGCPDYQSCNPEYRGLDRQLACAARTLRRWYDGSVAGDGLWVVGVAKRTLDPAWITPRSHATASLYAYTPWVQQGYGGNWLVWNVTRRFLRAIDAQGNLRPPI